MGVYDEDIAVAQELIAEFGQQCYWQKPAVQVGTSPGYADEEEEPEPIACMIAFFSARDLSRGADNWLQYMPSNMEVPVGGQIGLMAGGISFEPAATDTVRRGSPTATPIAIEALDLLAPNGTPVLYYVVVSA